MASVSGFYSISSFCFFTVQLEGEMGLFRWLKVHLFHKNSSNWRQRGMERSKGRNSLSKSFESQHDLALL